MIHEKICEACLSYMNDDILIGWLKCPACSRMIKKAKSMISMQEVLQNRAKFEDLSPEMQANGADLINKLNKFREAYGIPMVVSSGLRLLADNIAAGGATHSAHMTLNAVDFHDIDGKLFDFIKADPTILDRCNLWMEDARWCPNWIHLQNRPANERIFIPNSTPPKDPSRII